MKQVNEDEEWEILKKRNRAQTAVYLDEMIFSDKENAQWNDGGLMGTMQKTNPKTF